MTSAIHASADLPAGINEELLEDLLHCMICFEKYNQPKMMGCGHTFCQQCLEGYYKTYQQQKRAIPGKVPCPTCREFTKLPGGLVCNLRTDFKIAKLEDMFRSMILFHDKPKTQPNKCGLCKTKSKSQSFLCLTCTIFYCADCKKKHDKNPLFKSHSFSSAVPDNFRCKTHKEEEGKYYCCTCETVICTACTLSEHNDHNVTEVNEMFVQHQDDIHHLGVLVDEKMSKMRKQLEQVKLLRTLNLNSCQQAEILIKERTHGLIEGLKRQEYILLDELKKKQDDKLKLLSETIEQIIQVLSQGESLQSYAQMTSSKTSLRMLAVHDVLVQRIRTFLDADVEDDIYSDVVTFLPGKHTPEVGRIEIVSGTLEKLCSSPMAENPAKSVRIQSSKLRNIIDQQQILTSGLDKEFSQSMMRTNLKLLVNVNKCGNGVGELNDPIAIACLPNGDIAVAEWANQRIQIFDNVGHSKKIIGKNIIGPQGVAVTLRGNIIASDANQKRMQVFSSDGKSIATWGLGRFYAPCGVAVSANGNFIITDVAEHCVSIYQGERKCLKRLGAKGSSNAIFKNPLYVTTGSNNEIIVSDSDNHSIKVFDSTGNFVVKFGSEGSGDGQLKFPRGVAVDRKGNIIVSDRNNDRVCLFSSAGNFIRHLLTREDGLRDPYALALSLTGNLILTESSQSRAALKVFQLE